MTEQIKQPYELSQGAELDFEYDWSAWLQEGETITSQAVAAPSGITVSNVSQAGGIVTAWLEASASLALGTELLASCTITTSSTPSRTDTRAIRLVFARR